jgi:hypothetical protein
VFSLGGHKSSLDALIQNDVPQQLYMSSLGIMAIALAGAAVAAMVMAVTTAAMRENLRHDE